MRYLVTIEVDVHDPAELRRYALAKAEDAGPMSKRFSIQIDEAEFETGESGGDGNDPANIRYWLCWAFDAGTPHHCGFQIEDSHVGSYEIQRGEYDPLDDSTQI